MGVPLVDDTPWQEVVLLNELAQPKQTKKGNAVGKNEFFAEGHKTTEQMLRGE